MAWGLPVELAQGRSSRSTVAVHNVRHSGESRNPEGRCTGGHAESHHRDIAPNGCAKNPVRVICTTSQTTDSRSDHVRHPVAPTPLDSGFPPNDVLLQSTPPWIPAFAGMTDVCKAPTSGFRLSPE